VPQLSKAQLDILLANLDRVFTLLLFLILVAALIRHGLRWKHSNISGNDFVGAVGRSVLGLFALLYALVPFIWKICGGELQQMPRLDMYILVGCSVVAAGGVFLSLQAWSE
jgi:hypothetical protein